MTSVKLTTPKRGSTYGAPEKGWIGPKVRASAILDAIADSVKGETSVCFPVTMQKISLPEPSQTLVAKGHE